MFKPYINIFGNPHYPINISIERCCWTWTWYPDDIDIVLYIVKDHFKSKYVSCYWYVDEEVVSFEKIMDDYFDVFSLEVQSKIIFNIDLFID